VPSGAIEPSIDALAPARWQISRAISLVSRSSDMRDISRNVRCTD